MRYAGRLLRLSQIFNLPVILITMRTFILALIITLTYSLACAQQKLPIKRINVGLHVVRAEVASTEQQRQRGLMNRKSLGQNEGMLFVFDQPNYHCMWMKNTLIPLSVAFIDAQGVIVNIEAMQPQTDTTHCASRPVLYALEMNVDWFKRKNIRAGFKVELPR
jgi:hypothetical protein